MEDKVEILIANESHYGYVDTILETIERLQRHEERGLHDVRQIMFFQR